MTRDPSPASGEPPPVNGRARFASRLGALLTLIGVAVGLGNVWRFPYMVGRFGGTAFVLVYVAAVAVIGVPALMAEWTLGRSTRRGPVGAFAAAGLPFGRAAGRVFFLVVAAATAYYTNVLGWVLYHAVAQAGALVGWRLDASRILPPERGVSPTSVGLQLLCTGGVIVACAAVLRRGLRHGIEAASRWIMPALLIILLALIARGVTLPGSATGLRWYLGKFTPADLTPTVVLAALGQAIFSLSLGGTFMVVYGSYLAPDDSLAVKAAWTAAGDLAAGLLAGLAIFPAAFAMGFEPASGPSLIFDTLPSLFGRMPGGGAFGTLFFLGLFGAAYLSDIAAFEVLVAGLTDTAGVSRRAAVWWVAVLVSVLALPPMLNMRVFVPWDLTFGSGAQTVGALVAAGTVGWALNRGAALRELGGRRWLYRWVRYVVPLAILVAGIWGLIG